MPGDQPGGHDPDDTNNCSPGIGVPAWALVKRSSVAPPRIATRAVVMRRPVASWPWMPGYGTLAADERRGTSSLSWAEERLVRSQDYWLATATAPGMPHLMPVWAV